jgi:methionyl-tRNA formyltransferase
MNKKGYFNYINLKSICTDEDFFQDFCSIINFKIPSYVSNSTKNEFEILNNILLNRIDLIISVQHPWILPANIINKVDGMAFNLHNAKLPEYKGYNSISHAIINGDSHYYSTIHWMIDEVDQGDIVCDRKFPIAEDDDALSLYLKSIDNAKNVFTLFTEKHLLINNINRKAILNKGVFYKKNSLDKIKDVSRIDSADVFDRHVRAVYFPPYEPAFIKKGTKKYYQLPSNRKDIIIENITPSNLHQF